MNGHCSGVQTRIKQVAPKALYVHCNAHYLNLCLIDCAKPVSCAAEFFWLVQNIYVFLSSSKCNVIYISKQSVLYPGKSIRQLRRLSDTSQSAINIICYTFDAVVADLITSTDVLPSKNQVLCEYCIHISELKPRLKHCRYFN